MQDVNRKEKLQEHFSAPLKIQLHRYTLLREKFIPYVVSLCSRLKFSQRLA